MSHLSNPNIEQIMDDLDVYLEKVLYAQNMLAPTLQSAIQILAEMNSKERISILEKFAKVSQWTASLDEQLEWAASNQEQITRFGSELEEMEGVCHG